MAPDIGDRVAAILRSLQEVIIPAIDPSHKPAIDQAHLCVMNLQMIATQYDQVYHVAIAELQLFTRLLAKLDAEIGTIAEPELRAALDAAKTNPINDISAPPVGEIEGTTRAYREIADAVLLSPAVLADRRATQAVSRHILEHSREETGLRRSWTAAAGIESNPDLVPSIAAAIAAIASAGE